MKKLQIITITALMLPALLMPLSTGTASTTLPKERQ